MKNLYIYIIISIAVFAFVSCDKKEDTQANEYYTGKEYFPLRTGDTLIYKITEIRIDKESDVNDTVEYFVMETVESTFVDNNGDIAYRIEEYHKNLYDEQWIIHKVFSAKVTQNTAEKYKDNIKVIKLKFPIKLNYQWDGNIYNEYRITKERENTGNGKDSLFNITKINHKYENEFIKLDSCLTVTQYYNESLIGKNLVYEIYSAGIGLVCCEKMFMDAQVLIPGVAVEDRLTKATMYKQELIKWQFHY